MKGQIQASIPTSERLGKGYMYFIEYIQVHMWKQQVALAINSESQICKEDNQMKVRKERSRVEAFETEIEVEVEAEAS